MADTLKTKLFYADSHDSHGSHVDSHVDSHDSLARWLAYYTHSILAQQISNHSWPVRQKICPRGALSWGIAKILLCLQCSLSKMTVAHKKSYILWCFSIYSFVSLIRWDHNLHLFENYVFSFSKPSSSCRRYEVLLHKIYCLIRRTLNPPVHIISHFSLITFT